MVQVVALSVCVLDDDDLLQSSVLSFTLVLPSQTTTTILCRLLLVPKTHSAAVPAETKKAAVCVCPSVGCSSSWAAVFTATLRSAFSLSLSLSHFVFLSFLV